MSLERIATLLQNELVLQLNLPRQSKGYYGEPKRGISPPISSGNLVENITVDWIGSIENDDLELVVKMPYYGYWVNKGRRPGKMPPIAPIDRWVVQKSGFSNVIRDQSGRFVSRKSLVFLIRRSIGMYGYEGTEFVQKALANTYTQIVTEMGEYVGEWFLNIIRGYRED
jgi:hypothetical protein